MLRWRWFWLFIPLSLFLLGLGLFMFWNSQGPNIPEVDGEKVVWRFEGSQWRVHGKPPVCTDEENFLLPVDENLVTGILYPGQKRGGQFKPHGGFRFDDSLPNDIVVKAPATGYVDLAGRYLSEGQVQYYFDIKTSCGMMYRFDHAVELSPKLQQAFSFLPEPKEGDSRGHYLPEAVLVERGEVLATSVGFANFMGRPNVFVDFGVYDLRQPNVASQASTWPADDYNWSELAPYAVCWLDNLESELAQKLRQLPAGSEGKVSTYCD